LRFALVLAALGVQGAVQGAPAQKRPALSDSRLPNFVLIVADDLGWNDVGYHGGQIRTPVLDRLAREGVQLHHHYVYPTCSPTRACLLTGRNAARFGIFSPIGVGPDVPRLPLEVRTLPEALRERGYATGLVGKWHLGASIEYGPNRQGFDEFYGYLHGQVDQFTHQSRDLEPIWLRNEQPIEDPGHATDLFAREAVAFINRHARQPFFLEVAFSVPHYPLQVEERWIAAYQDSIEHPERRLYAGMVSHMDHAVGQIIGALDSAGVRQKTLVVFTSDNGGQKDWQNQAYGGKHGPYQRLADNHPLRGWKGQLYEGGVRAVAFANWPGRLCPGVLNGRALACDWYPTIMRLAGLPPAVEPGLEGFDLWPALACGQPLPGRQFHWKTNRETGYLWEDWKLIRRPAAEDGQQGQIEELYHLATDPLEQRDLARDRPEVARQLARALDRQLARDQRVPASPLSNMGRPRGAASAQ
jgi:arylsulfatase A-like enzyme